MRLEARLSKLEENMSTNEFVVYSVNSGEDPEVKKALAWNNYVMNGGFQEQSKTSFVQINKL